MNLQDTFEIIHDSGDIKNGNGIHGVDRTVQGRAEGVGPIKIHIHIDSSYPSQGHAYLALWTTKEGFERFATLDGAELVTPRNGYNDARDTQDIGDQLIDLAGAMLGGDDD